MEGVLVDLFNLRGPSAMICSVDWLTLVVAEVADTMIYDGPELFPEAVSALMRQTLLKGHGLQGLGPCTSGGH